MENENVVNAEVTNNDQDTVVQGTEGTTETQGEAVNSATAVKSEENKDEGAEQSATSKPKQDSATNKAFQSMRKEHKKALEEAQRQERVRVIKEMYPTNPYTSKPIEDEYDVDEFLLMRRIETEGGDPVSDYSAYLKNETKSKHAQQKNELEQKRAKEEKVSKDIADFSQKYAEVNVKELLADEDFRTFADGKLDNRSLSEVYEQFLPIKAKIEGQRKQQEQDALRLATEKAAVGSLATPRPNAKDEYFTQEEVLKMSPAEIKKNYEKIRASQQRW